MSVNGLLYAFHFWHRADSQARRMRRLTRRLVAHEVEERLAYCFPRRARRRNVAAALLALVFVPLCMAPLSSVL